jgi:hypothetical protein
MKSAQEQISRMKEAANVSKNSELASILGERQTTLSSWKNRGVPEGQLHRAANILKCSVEWLAEGKGEMRPQQAAGPDTHDPELAREVEAARKDRYGRIEPEPLVLTQAEASIIEYLRDLPAEIRVDEYDNIRELWLRHRQRQTTNVTSK